MLWAVERLPILLHLDSLCQYCKIEGMSTMTDKTVAFRQNVRRHLSDRRITQGELARRTRLSQAWLSEMLNGKANPSLQTCEKIANALGVALEGLIAEPPAPVSIPEKSAGLAQTGVDASS